MFENQETVPIHTTSGPIEEAEVCSVLDEAGIKYEVQEFEDDAFSGLFEPVLGHSRISVLEDDVEKAKEVIQPIVEQFQQSDDEEPSEES
ncbi:MAG: DUF2007 domain-containing protein [bacterium]